MLTFLNNYFTILEKELVTPPLSSGLILPGITRNSILAIAREWNQFKVSERKLCMDEVCQLLTENRVRSFFFTECIFLQI